MTVRIYKESLSVRQDFPQLPGFSDSAKRLQIPAHKHAQNTDAQTT